MGKKAIFRKHCPNQVCFAKVGELFIATGKTNHIEKY